MCTSYHISFHSGRRVIKILSPHLPFLYPQKDLAVPSYQVTCFSSYIQYGVLYKLIRHHIITPLHALPPLAFIFHLSRHQPPAAAGHCRKQASPLTCAFFPCRQLQALRLQLQLVSIDHHCGQRPPAASNPSPQNEDCCTCSKAC